MLVLLLNLFKMNNKQQIWILMLLISSFTFAQNWQLNFEKAKEMALQENKPIILVFSGSDWCGPCIKLDNQIWKSEEFKNYVAKNYVLVKADFPRKKTNSLSKEQLTHNENLAEKYNKKGYFPMVIVFNANGKVLGETGYKNVSPKEYIQHLQSFIK